MCVYLWKYQPLIRMSTIYHSNRIFFVVLIVACLVFSNLNAQNCGCTHVITTNSKSPVIWDAAIQTPAVTPGSVLCFMAGTRARITLKNVIGTKENPIIIKNCGGLAIIEGEQGGTYTPFWIQNSKHLIVSGNGDTGFEYGIHVKGGSNGIAFDALTTNVEARYLEVSHTGFAGIMAKTDPECSKPATWRENFTMYDVKLHHNFVHDVEGEGFYVGNSFYVLGHPSTRSCIFGTDTIQKFAHVIDGVDIYNNLVLRTGCEGIQVGSAPRNCKIHDNIIDRTGLNPFANFQNNGLQIGNGTGGLVYNNFIRNSPGNGVSCLGIGDNFLFNNIIINSGDGTSTSNSAIFMDEQAHPDSVLGTGMKFVNNTIINPRENAFRIYNDRISNTLLENNLVVHLGTSPKYVQKLNNSVNVTELTNLYLNSIPAGLFVNASIDDYRIKPSSIAAGTGTNVSSLGITYDLNNFARTANDIGAFAVGSPMLIITKDTLVTSVTDFQQNTNFIYPNPVRDVIYVINATFGNDTELKVLDLYGTTLIQEKNIEKLDVSELPKGMYLLQIDSKSKKYQYKFLKD